MNDKNIHNQPSILHDIEDKSREIGFTMPSDLYVGSLLKTLITARPASNLLELGTGIGLSLAWMIDGMDKQSSITSIDNDPELSKIAQVFFGKDERVKIVCADGSDWIKSYDGPLFDLVFADAWPGKYSDLDELLKMIKTGGLYIIDDMSTQPNWPEGHDENVSVLIAELEQREDLTITKMNWSTGLIICAKK